MQKYQKPIIDKKIKELTNIANDIEELNLSEKWTMVFTSMCCYRCWMRLNKKQQSQMINISNVNSSAIELIIAERFKKVGLDLIEKIAVEIHSEATRAKAVDILLTKGAKKGYRDVLLLITDHKNKYNK